MRLSPGAVLLGLAAVHHGGVPPGVVARCLQSVAARQAPDDLVALQRELCESVPAARALVPSLSRDCMFLPVQCPECGARLRAHAWQFAPGVSCPVCDSPLLVPRNAATLVTLDAEARRAAEPTSAYLTRGRVWLFAHFELLRLIGAGNCGKAYEARNLKTGQVVALKVLEFLPLESRRRAFRRLIRQVRFAAGTEHPNIVPILDVGLGGGVPYIEMQLMPGGLDSYVARRGPVPWPEASRYLLEVLSALSFSHAQGLIHGNLSPANILLDGAGHARVTDFGLLALASETCAAGGANAPLGSPHFMAPEQWQGGEVSPATDVYAAGLLGYSMMTGRLAFEGENAMTLLYKHLHVPVQDPGAAVPEIPASIALAVQKASSKSPAERFRTAEDFAAAVRDLR